MCKEGKGAVLFLRVLQLLQFTHKFLGRDTIISIGFYFGMREERETSSLLPNQRSQLDFSVIDPSHLDLQA